VSVPFSCPYLQLSLLATARKLTTVKSTPKYDSTSKRISICQRIIRILVNIACKLNECVL
jgi:hypothetical protein